jgi:hypothetical protein
LEEWGEKKLRISDEIKEITVAARNSKKWRV